MYKEIYLLGLNYRTASVEIRERFALNNHCSPESWAITHTPELNESLILSTCNRVEILTSGNDLAPDYVLACWAKTCNYSIDELIRYTYSYTGIDAVRHLFTVASSLDSMVLGEPQILGQLKDAYRKAVDSKNTGAILNTLIHKSFSVAKRVRTETAVASSAVSISYAAVELAKRIFGDMQNHTALLIGAGEMAELAATHLLQAGIKNLFVANRTFARAESLAKQMGGKAIPFDELYENLQYVDIVITSTGSQEAIIRAKDIEKVLKKRKQKPMFFIDIAVPRDIDPDVNNLDNVYLYDIDDLKDVVEENLAGRRDEAEKAKLIIEEEVINFSHWLKSLDAQPTIIDIKERGEEIAAIEIARALKRIGPVDDHIRETIEFMANSLVRKMNHEPITFLKRGNMAKDGTASRVSITRQIFNLDGHRISTRKK